jgi:hypothetical protein
MVERNPHGHLSVNGRGWDRTKDLTTDAKQARPDTELPISFGQLAMILMVK